MTRLSVNVNKVATVRNSRGGEIPSVVEAARVCVGAGAPGITVHPRLDQRHIRPDDVRLLADMLKEHPDVEFNIEGDARPDLIALVQEVEPAQCTLVPVLEGEVTSQGGWPESTDEEALRATVQRLQGSSVRVSIFIEAKTEAVTWVKSLGADRVELFTEPFAIAYQQGEAPARASFAAFRMAAEQAHSLGLGVNAGHDLDEDNLVLFRELPYLDEVSIGHALISQAIFDGLETTVKRYLQVLAGSSKP